MSGVLRDVCPSCLGLVFVDIEVGIHCTDESCEVEHDCENFVGTRLRMETPS